MTAEDVERWLANAKLVLDEALAQGTPFELESRYGVKLCKRGNGPATWQPDGTRSYSIHITSPPRVELAAEPGEKLPISL